VLTLWLSEGDCAPPFVMNDAPTARLAALEASAAAVEAEGRDAAERKRCLDAVHASRAAAHTAAKRKRVANAERYTRNKLARAAAEGDVSAAAALAPMLRTRAGARSTLAARRAGALLRGVVAPLLGARGTVRLVELCLRLRLQPQLLRSRAPRSCSRARRRR